MPQTEFTIFLAIVTILLLTFSAGILLFFIQYRKYKLKHMKEKLLLNEQHAKELLFSQIEIQQQTMQYIGREIHDSVGQKLTLASLYNQQLSHTNNYPDLHPQLTAIGNIINESLTELRNLSKSLTSDNPGDLQVLLQKECEQVNLTDICKAALTMDVEHIPIPQLYKNVILRIVQEFIQNSLKHSGCTQISIQMSKAAAGTMIMITDNGKGFDTTNSEKAQFGMGLINMKRRAAAIGALITLHSTPGTGTTLQLTIPQYT